MYVPISDEIKMEEEKIDLEKYASEEFKKKMKRFMEGVKKGKGNSKTS